MRPSWSSGKTLAANGGGRGFESHRGQNLFFTFYSIKVECEELICKTNKNLKLTEKIISSEMTTFIEMYVYKTYLYERLSSISWWSRLNYKC